MGMEGVISELCYKGTSFFLQFLNSFVKFRGKINYHIMTSRLGVK